MVEKRGVQIRNGGENPRPATGKTAKRRDAIIRAAIEVINEKSFALATMTDIAASLDLRDAALYYYFDSKQALAYACHVRSLERFQALLLRTAEAGGTGHDKLGRFLRIMMEDADVNGPELYFGDYSYLTAEQRDDVSARAAELTATIERFARAGIEDGSIVECEPRIVVQLILGMLIWLAKWVPGVQGLTVDRLMAAITVTALDGLKRR